MKRCAFLLLLFCVSCESKTTTEVVTDVETVRVEEPAVPETRTAVKSAPVAEYSQPIADELNDWKFSVALYETKRTFHYTVRVQGKEVRVSDSINIPNFGIEPKVAIRKGKNDYTAVIGFFDRKNVFQEYREVGFVNDRLRMRTLNSYAVNTYKKTVK